MTGKVVWSYNRRLEKHTDVEVQVGVCEPHAAYTVMGSDHLTWGILSSSQAVPQKRQPTVQEQPKKRKIINCQQLLGTKQKTAKSCLLHGGKFQLTAHPQWKRCILGQKNTFPINFTKLEIGPEGPLVMSHRWLIEEIAPSFLRGSWQCPWVAGGTVMLSVWVCLCSIPKLPCCGRSWRSNRLVLHFSMNTN